MSLAESIFWAGMLPQATLPPPGMRQVLFAVLVAVVLGVVALRLGPTFNRRFRSPLFLLGVWSLSIVAWAIPFIETGWREWAMLLAVVSLALAGVRTGWLLIVDLLLDEGRTIGLSRISQDLLLSGLLLVTALAAARTAGADAQALATTGGLVTAGLTFSLQQTLSDLVAGVLLQAESPFKVGDWIAYDDVGKHIGRVVEINWRATKIITSDRIEHTIPNSLLARVAIANFREPVPYSRRAIYFEVGYQHPPAKVRGLATQSILGVEHVLADPAPVCIVDDFAASGVKYRLWYHTHEVEKRDGVDGGVRERLWYAFKRAGIDFVFPRMDLSILSEQDVRALELEREVAYRRELVDRVDFLVALPAKERDAVARGAHTELFSAGEFVVREGDSTTDMYLVAEGVLAVTREDGKVELARLKRGGFFGEMALLTGERRRASVHVVEAATLIVLDKKHFQKIVEAHPACLEVISAVVTSRQLDTNNASEQSMILSKETQSERAHTLLERMRRFFSFD